MDVSWSSEPQPGAPGFDNDASPYAHYWLSTLPPADPGSPRGGRRQGTVALTSRLEAGTEELIDRAFRDRAFPP